MSKKDKLKNNLSLNEAYTWLRTEFDSIDVVARDTDNTVDSETLINGMIKIISLAKMIKNQANEQRREIGLKTIKD